MDKIFHLVYISKAVDDLSYTDIEDILAASRTSNKRQNITGVLIYREGYFLQVLEGDENAIRTLVEKIKEDDRNFSLRVIIEEVGHDRMFEDWSMAFVDGDLVKNSTLELIEFFDTCLSSGVKKNVMIMPIVRKFRASAPDLK